MQSVAYQLVREVRERAGLSQAQLAARLGCHQSTVARWESGSVEVELGQLTRLAEVCGFALRVEIMPIDYPQRALIEDFGALDPAARLRAATRSARLAAKAARVTH